MCLRLVCFMLLCVSSLAYAQEIPAGTKIRVKQRIVSSNPAFQDRSYQVNGRFVGRSADSLYFTVDSTTRVLPLSHVARLDYATGTKSGTWKGMRTGAFIGGAAIGLLAATSEAGCTGFCFGIGGALAIGAVVGAVPGGLIGALIGSTKRIDRWQEMRFEDR